MVVRGTGAVAAYNGEECAFAGARQAGCPAWKPSRSPNHAVVFWGCSAVVWPRHHDALPTHAEAVHPRGACCCPPHALAPCARGPLRLQAAPTLSLQAAWRA